MHSKTETRSCFTAFFNLIQTQFNAKVKVVRSDNGAEFQMNFFFFSWNYPSN